MLKIPKTVSLILLCSASMLVGADWRFAGPVHDVDCDRYSFFDNDRLTLNGNIYRIWEREIKPSDMQKLLKSMAPGRRKSIDDICNKKLQAGYIPILTSMIKQEYGVKPEQIQNFIREWTKLEVIVNNTEMEGDSTAYVEVDGAKMTYKILFYTLKGPNGKFKSNYKEGDSSYIVPGSNRADTFEVVKNAIIK